MIVSGVQQASFALMTAQFHSPANVVNIVRLISPASRAVKEHTTMRPKRRMNHGANHVQLDTGVREKVKLNLCFNESI